ncbi:hypothetical protein AAF712_016312 [Marasmius tenuissimus]|uniref:Myb/SANT-like domain-containing protein n=1 Tax=Marasmius tenuissimus TaxID=585030 RepID=A0ABR2Z739_9AGAR
MPPKGSEGSKRAVWGDRDDQLLIEGLVAAKKAGHGKTGGWALKVWTPVVESLNAAKGQKGEPKTATSSLKKLQKEVKILHKCSGFGWDDEEKVPTASDEVWDALVARTMEYDPKGKAKKNKYLHWHKTPFPLYDDIYYIVNGKRATALNEADKERKQSIPLTQSWSPSPPQDAELVEDDADNVDDPDSQQSTVVSTINDPLDDLTPSSPAPAMPVKCLRGAESTTPVLSSKKHGGLRTADSTFVLAGAMKDVAHAISSDRKRKAVTMAMEDGFDDDEIPFVQCLLTCDSDVSRIYATMTPVDICM